MGHAVDPAMRGILYLYSALLVMRIPLTDFTVKTKNTVFDLFLRWLLESMCCR